MPDESATSELRRLCFQNSAILKPIICNMSIWNYISEFILFRWLFGNRNKSHHVVNSHPVDTTDYTPRRVDIEDYIANDLDDDLRLMRGSEYGRSNRHKDYSDYGYQPYDDFLDEQDDYDMMDDDF